MRVKPIVLNAAIAWLFMVGSACFVLGSVPAYLNAVGGTDRRRHLLRRLALLHLRLVRPARPGADPGDDRRRRAAASTCRRRCGSGRGCRTTATGSPPPTQFPGTLFFNVSTLAALAHNATAQQERPPRLAAGPLRVDALPRRERVRRSSPLGPVPQLPATVRCRGGSPGSTCSAPCSSWPRRWPATSCRAPTRCSTSGSPSPAPCSAPCASSSAPR